MFWVKDVEKIKETHFTFNSPFFPPENPSVNKAKYKHPECVILIAFPRQQLLSELALMLFYINQFSVLFEFYSIALRSVTCVQTYQHSPFINIFVAN